MPPARALSVAGLRGGSRGAVTAELAVAIPAVVLLFGVILTAVAAGVAQVRAEEAARAAARELARGEPPNVVAATVQRMAGAGARPEVKADGETVSVTIRVAVSGPFAAAVGLVAEASAALPAEPPP